MAKILFVSKNPDGAKISARIAAECQNEGHEIVVIAEGAEAIKRYKDVGFEILNSGEREEGVIISRRDLFIVLLQSVIKPDLLVTTKGLPEDIEQDAAIAALSLKMNVFVGECPGLEDFLKE